MVQENVQEQRNRVAKWWSQYDRKQKRRIAGISMVTLAALVMLVWFILRTDYVPLYENLGYTSRVEVSNLLAENGIDSRITSNGKVLSVRREDRTLAAQIVESSTLRGKEGYMLVDVLAADIGAAQQVTRESLRQIYKAEVEELLRGYKGVRAVNAMITITNNTNFFVASAAIHLETTQQLTRADGENMARLVSKALPDLAMEDVVITDANYTPLYSGGAENESAISQQREAELAMAAYVQGSVKATLLPLYDDVQTIANFHFNWNKINEQSTRYSGPVEGGATGYVSQEQASRTQTIGANGEDTEGAQAAEDNAVTSVTNSRAAEYLYDQVIRNTESSVGDFLRENSSLTVIAYKYKEYDEASLRKAGRLGDMTWQEFKESVDEPRKLAVDEDLLMAVKVGTGIENVALTAFEIPVFLEAEAGGFAAYEQMAMILLCLVLIAMLAFALFKRPRQEEAEDAFSPELAVEELLVSPQLEEQKELELAALERLREIECSQDSETKKQIEQFVSERPDMVAQMLRDWLHDDWLNDDWD